MRGYVANRYGSKLLEDGLAENLETGARGALEMAGASPENADKYAWLAAMIPEFIPGLGASVGINNTARAIDEGNYGQAAFEGILTAIGEIPIAGDAVGKAMRGGADKLGIFGSRRAKTADQKGADAAQLQYYDDLDEGLDRMDHQEVANSHFNQMAASADATGGKQPWFVGPDEKPRFEINDNGARLGDLLQRPSLGRTWDQIDQEGNRHMYLKTNLEGVLNHSQLYKNYPQLKNMPVILRHPDEIGRETAAQYFPPQREESIIGPDGMIGLNIWDAMSDPKNKVIANVLHEVQHAVQNVEGLARGSSPETALVDAQKWLRKNKDATQEGPMSDRFFKADKQDKVAGLLRNYEDAVDMGEDDGFWEYVTYLMSAGETEARAVERRLRLTGKDRVDDWMRNPPGFDYRMAEPVDRHMSPTLFQYIDLIGDFD